MCTHTVIMSASDGASNVRGCCVSPSLSGPAHTHTTYELIPPICCCFRSVPLFCLCELVFQINLLLPLLLLQQFNVYTIVKCVLGSEFGPFPRTLLLLLALLSYTLRPRKYLGSFLVCVRPSCVCCACSVFSKHLKT